MLELRNLNKLYSGIPAVSDVSFVARPGIFRFEELGFDVITPGFCRVFFRDMEIG